MHAAGVAPLASTAYDIGRAIGYLVIPLIIGGIILFIARSQNRSAATRAAVSRADCRPPPR